MNPIIQFSEDGGELALKAVPGSLAVKPNPENEVEAAEGLDRSMFVYVPKSGCPHPKQCQVLFAYRDGADRKSAEALLDRLGLIELAEREHIIVVLPNPLEGGWNYQLVGQRDDDASFIVRCFGALKDTTGVSGFNGMMFHLAATEASSAMVWSLALTRPLDVSAMMLGSFPTGYAVPTASDAQQVAWLYEKNDYALDYLRRVDRTRPTAESLAVAARYANPDNDSVAVYESPCGLSSTSVASAWREMFSCTRRWRNDVFGTFQSRVDFEGAGMVPHLGDSTLALDDGLPRTWYEYVPERLRNTVEPIPLVLYFHGINCMGLYGAEQSGWMDIADRDGFAVVFPDATVSMRWNGYFDNRLPSDVDYVFALIEHMDSVHPIDRSRIYLSGFSMGAMFSNALAAAYPEHFAGVVAVNAPMVAYFQTLEEGIPGLLKMQKASELLKIEHREEAVSPMHALADVKRAERSLPVPFVQFAGLLDNVGFNSGHVWPVVSEDDGDWAGTVAFWKRVNGATGELFDSATKTGLASDAVSVDDRFYHQSWTDAQGHTVPYHLIAAERMPHAVDLREIELGWDIIKHFSRNQDGTLTESE